MNKPYHTNHTARNIPCAAQTERALWRAWIKSTKEEEKVRFLSDLVSKGVGLHSNEGFVISEEWQAVWVRREKLILLNC